VPFLLTSLGIERFLKFYNRFKFHMHAVEVASGVLLIALGILLVMGRFTSSRVFFVLESVCAVTSCMNNTICDSHPDPEQGEGRDLQFYPKFESP